MSRFEITVRTTVTYDNAVIALANHRATYPHNTETRPTSHQARLAIESVFAMLGEDGLDKWILGAQTHATWAKEQVDRLLNDFWPMPSEPEKHAQQAAEATGAAPRTWTAPESPEGVTEVRDRHGRQWGRETFGSEWVALENDLHLCASWPTVLAVYGPLSEVTA